MVLLLPLLRRHLLRTRHDGPALSDESGEAGRVVKWVAGLHATPRAAGSAPIAIVPRVALSIHQPLVVANVCADSCGDGRRVALREGVGEKAPL